MGLKSIYEDKKLQNEPENSSDSQLIEEQSRLIREQQEQISELSSTNLTLMSELRKRSETIKSLNEKIGRLAESDNVLKLNEELKMQNEKLKQDKLTVEHQAETAVLNVKREYEAKIRELDRRIGEAAKQSAELEEKRAGINQEVKQIAMAMYQSRRKELESKFKAQSLCHEGFILGLLLYGVLTTAFTAVRSKAFVSDFKTFFVTIGQFVVNAVDLLLKGGKWASQLGNMIPQPIVANAVHYLLWIIFVGVIAFGIGFLVLLVSTKVLAFYTNGYADETGLAVFLLSLAVVIFFAEPIRTVVPINLLLLVFLVHAVYVLIRWYVKGCKRSRGYY